MCISLMPADPVPFGKCYCSIGAPATCAVVFRLEPGFFPKLADCINPFPLFFYLVPTHEQRLIAFDQIEKQPLIRNSTTPKNNAGSEIQESHLSGINLSRVERIVAVHQPIFSATSAALACPALA